MGVIFPFLHIEELSTDKMVSRGSIRDYILPLLRDLAAQLKQPHLQQTFLQVRLP